MIRGFLPKDQNHYTYVPNQAQDNVKKYGTVFNHVDETDFNQKEHSERL